jgi:uncharacterized protein YjbI with pentapeptide repeats
VNPITSLVTPTAVFVGAAFYLGITAASVTHVDLLVGGTVTLPVLDTPVPLTGPLGFCWIGPLLLLGLHASLLLRQYVVVQAALESGHLSKRTDPTFELVYPTVPMSRSLLRGWFRYLVKLVYLVAIGALPLGVLLAFQLAFLPLHGPKITLWHQIFVVTDLLLVWFVIGTMTTASLSLRRSFWIRAARDRWWWLAAPIRFAQRRPTKTLGALGSIGVLYLTLCVAILPGSWPESFFGVARWPSVLAVERNLQLGNAVLVLESPAPQMLVYELERSRSAIEAERVIDEAWRRHGRGLDLSGRDFRNADFTGARLYNAIFRGANLQDASLRGAHLEGADFSSSSYRRTRLDGADLRDSYLEKANFTGARMEGADLRRTRGKRVILEDAVLSNARLAEADLGELRASGSRLDGADLTDAQLSNSSFDDASMVGATLSHANLDGSDYRACNLRGALLAGVGARAVDFSAAKTQGAIFRGADLRSTVDLQTPFVDLGQSRLHGARFGWAGMGPTPNFTDLRGVDGLTERPPASSQPLLFDADNRPAALADVPGPAPQARFHSELATVLVEEACTEDSPVQFMEALLRRSVGCFGPREPELERSLRATLLARIEAQTNQAAWAAVTSRQVVYEGPLR